MNKKSTYASYVLSSFLIYVSGSMILPLVITYGKSANQLSTLIVAFTLYPIAQFFVTPILCAIADRHGKKRILVRATLMNAILIFLQALTLKMGLPIVFLILRTCSGMCDMTLAMAKAAGFGLPLRDQARYIGLLNSSKYIGYALGPIVFGLALFSDVLALDQIYGSIAVLYLFIVFLFVVTLPKDDDARELNGKKRYPLFRSFVEKENAFPFMLCAAVTIPVDAFANGLPLIFSCFFDINMQTVSYGLGLSAAVNVLTGLFVSAWCHRKLDFYQILALCFIAVSLTSFLIKIYPTLFFYFACCMSGVCSALVSNAVTLMANSLWESGSAKYLATLSSLRMFTGSSMLMVIYYFIDHRLNPLNALMAISFLSCILLIIFRGHMLGLNNRHDTPAI